MGLPILPRRAVQSDGVPLLIAEQLQHTLDCGPRVVKKKIVQEGEARVVNIVEENGAGATTGAFADCATGDEEESSGLSEGWEGGMER